MSLFGLPLPPSQHTSSLVVDRFVLPQPDVMKIHHSVLDHFLLNVRSKASNKGVEEIYTSTLSVSLGLGNGRNMRSSPVHDGVKQGLIEKHPHEHIQQLLKSTLDTSHVPVSSSKSGVSVFSEVDDGLWGTAFMELSASAAKSRGGDISAQDLDTCGFSKLTFSHGYDQSNPLEDKSAASYTAGNVFVIDGLGHIASDSSTPSSCYASLLAFLATHDEHIADIRYTLPNKILNKYGKSVVQKMTSDQGTPYTDAGLTGVGQVVGVGDTGVDERSCFFANADDSFV